MIRLGILCSAGGSVVEAGLKILSSQGYQVELAMVTDRVCEAESVADRMGLLHKRIEYKTRNQFSSDVSNWFYDDLGLEWCCMFFLRLVSSKLFSRAPCINIHPSLLPAFRGLAALKQAHKAGVRFFGATAHLVIDENVDTGPILGQVIAPLTQEVDISVMQRISYAHKLYLFLALAEKMDRPQGIQEIFNFKLIDSHNGLASPCLSNPDLQKAFKDYIAKQDIPWIVN